jgi:N-acetylglucosamine-6-phosphate deacetylase
MASAVRNVMTQADLPLRTAVGMASAVPARFLRVAEETGTIAPGLRADLVLVDGGLRVKRTWIDGAAA